MPVLWRRMDQGEMDVQGIQEYCMFGRDYKCKKILRSQSLKGKDIDEGTFNTNFR